MGRIDDTNARILEIGIELGELRRSRLWFWDLYDWPDWLASEEKQYAVFERLCLLFMEYEELTRQSGWTRLPDGTIGEYRTVRGCEGGCTFTTGTYGPFNSVNEVMAALNT